MCLREHDLPQPESERQRRWDIIIPKAPTKRARSQSNQSTNPQTVTRTDASDATDGSIRPQNHIERQSWAIVMKNHVSLQFLDCFAYEKESTSQCFLGPVERLLWSSHWTPQAFRWEACVDRFSRRSKRRVVYINSTHVVIRSNLNPSKPWQCTFSHLMIAHVAHVFSVIPEHQFEHIGKGEYKIPELIVQFLESIDLDQWLRLFEESLKATKRAKKK